MSRDDITEIDVEDMVSVERCEADGPLSLCSAVEKMEDHIRGAVSVDDRTADGMAEHIEFFSIGAYGSSEEEYRLYAATDLRFA